MSDFKYYTKEDAPTESQALIDQSVAAYSFLPNLHAILAESPITYKSYLDTFGAFESSSLEPVERQVVFMVSNYHNNCHYCVPGHSMIMTMLDVPQDIIEDLREGRSLKDQKLETLRSFTKSLLENRGHIENSELQAFLSAGYTKQHAFDILTGLASKLISNFTNAIAKTEIDEPVKKFAWTHPDHR